LLFSGELQSETDIAARKLLSIDFHGFRHAGKKQPSTDFHRHGQAERNSLLLKISLGLCSFQTRVTFASVLQAWS